MTDNDNIGPGPKLGKKLGQPFSVQRVASPEDAPDRVPIVSSTVVVLPESVATSGTPIDVTHIPSDDFQKPEVIETGERDAIQVATVQVVGDGPPIVREAPYIPQVPRRTRPLPEPAPNPGEEYQLPRIRMNSEIQGAIGSTSGILPVQVEDTSQKPIPSPDFPEVSMPFTPSNFEEDPKRIPRKNLSRALAAGLLLSTGLLIPANCNDLGYKPQQETPQITFPETPEPQENIFSIDNHMLTIHPEGDYGISSYAKVIAAFSLEDLVSRSREEQLKLVRDARVSKDELPYIRTISENIVLLNASGFQDLDFSVSGFKDPSKNKLTHNELWIPTSVLPTIFDYRENSSTTIEDDRLSITALVPGAGLSSYIIASTSNGISPTNLALLSKLPLLLQAELVKQNMPDVTQGTIEDNTLLLDFLATTIEYNPGVFDEVDITDKGLCDPKKNILKLYDKIEVSPHYPSELVLESESEFRSTLSPLERLANDYLEVSRFSQEFSYFPEENQRMLRDISLRIASSYNANQRKNPTQDLSSLNRSERLEIACSLYKNANNRPDTQTYMTVEDILDLVNFGSDQKISSRDLYSSTSFRRSDSLSQSVTDRRSKILEDYMHFGVTGKKSEFVRAASEKYGVSESTIYRDLKNLESTAIDPKEYDNPRIIEEHVEFRYDPISSL
jgi:hypothetical protein